MSAVIALRAAAGCRMINVTGTWPPFLKGLPIRQLGDGEIFPGSATQSDEAIAEHCRRTVKTGYHPVGTCRVGADNDPMAVLDDRLKVRGYEGLRVIDASMMPNIISGNTNAVVLAVADKAADIMLGSR